MHIAIITRSLPPSICGIGDHTGMLGKAIRSQSHKVTLVAGTGSSEADNRIMENFWHRGNAKSLIQELTRMNIDHVILQYTPQLFTIDGQWQDSDMIDFWSACSDRWKTSLILHETYFRVWWHPPSWWRGTLQKHLLRRLASKSNHIFTASTTLIKELNHWGLRAKIVHLPIGSNFPLHQADRDLLRKKNALTPEKILLTLFGGGTALRNMKRLVNRLDQYLKCRQMPVTWLILGGISQDWFKLSLPTISPGQLSPEEISSWLQMSDVFLVPHQPGLNAKRGTLMAALQHGLPVVGTSGPMTDAFWKTVPGVNLIPQENPAEFCDAVSRLCLDEKLRQGQGRSNSQYYQQNFTWGKIANTLLNTLS